MRLLALLCLETTLNIAFQRSFWTYVQVFGRLDHGLSRQRFDIRTTQLLPLSTLFGEASLMITPNIVRLVLLIAFQFRFALRFVILGPEYLVELPILGATLLKKCHFMGLKRTC